MKIWKQIGIGTVFAVASGLVAVGIWVGTIKQEVTQHGSMLSEHENRIRDLEHNVIALKTLKSVEERGMTARIPQLPEWQDYNGEYQVQLYVVDNFGNPLAGARVRSDRTGDKVTTSEGGLTVPLWSKLGEKFVIEQEGYDQGQFTLDQYVVARKTMSNVVILRRKDHV